MNGERIILDSELLNLLSVLRMYDLSFLGSRAPRLAEELAVIIEDHLDGMSLFVGYDPRTQQDFLDD